MLIIATHHCGRGGCNGRGTLSLPGSMRCISAEVEGGRDQQSFQLQLVRLDTPSRYVDQTIDELVSWNMREAPNNQGVGRVKIFAQQIRAISLAFIRSTGTHVSSSRLGRRALSKASGPRTCVQCGFANCYQRWLLRPAGLIQSSQDAPRLGSGEPLFAAVDDWIRTLFFHSPPTPVRPHSTWSEMSHRAGGVRGTMSVYLALEQAPTMSMAHI
ncbi:uncharacterized protein LY79DRAFT_415111 [Colletotrichum navitas]|uniref:Uncharacterized protein n=1 Tax=Colletotrichum navitas TaxID=681940 RepID=A0AAD8UZJ0_9PEZI|nr:uncharacterized protein LY79DRAFT_415111 [Colletotrichum navitas]KAK1573223.1 hypothetical protein LY79DRAFT_415111 [Colletotrichum navitas]